MYIILKSVDIVIFSSATDLVDILQPLVKALTQYGWTNLIVVETRIVYLSVVLQAGVLKTAVILRMLV